MYAQADSRNTGKLKKMRRGQNTSLDRTLTADQSEASEGSIVPSCILRGTRQGKSLNSKTKVYQDDHKLLSSIPQLLNKPLKVSQYFKNQMPC